MRRPLVATFFVGLAVVIGLTWNAPPTLPSFAALLAYLGIGDRGTGMCLALLAIGAGSLVTSLLRAEGWSRYAAIAVFAFSPLSAAANALWVSSGFLLASRQRHRRLQLFLVGIGLATAIVGMGAWILAVPSTHSIAVLLVPALGLVGAKLSPRAGLAIALSALVFAISLRTQGTDAPRFLGPHGAALSSTLPMIATIPGSDELATFPSRPAIARLAGRRPITELRPGIPALLGPGTKPPPNLRPVQVFSPFIVCVVEPGADARPLFAATHLLRSGQPWEAIEALTEAPSRSIAADAIHGQALAQVGRWEEAVDILSRSVEFDPSLRGLLLEALIQTERWEPARAQVDALGSSLSPEGRLLALARIPGTSTDADSVLLTLAASGDQEISRTAQEVAAERALEAGQPNRAWSVIRPSSRPEVSPSLEARIFLALEEPEKAAKLLRARRPGTALEAKAWLEAGDLARARATLIDFAARRQHPLLEWLDAFDIARELDDPVLVRSLLDGATTTALMLEPRASARLALALTDYGATEKAWTVLRASKSKLDAEQIITMARVASVRRDTTGVGALVAIAEALPCSEPDLLLRLSEAAFHSGRHELALSAAQDALRIRPEWAEALAAAADARRGLGHLRSARQGLDDASSSSSVHRAIGDIHRHHEEFDEAAASYRRALDIDPDNGDALAGLAVTGWNDEDRERLENALWVRREDTGLAVHLADRHLKVGRWDDAIAILQTIVEKEPDRWDSWLQLVEALRRSENLREAARVSAHLLEAGSAASLGAAALAMNKLHGQEPGDAAQDVVTALAMNPEEPALIRVLARALYAQGKTREATRLLVDAAPPDTPGQAILRGETLLEFGSARAAASMVTSWLGPDRPQAITMAEQVRAARILAVSSPRGTAILEELSRRNNLDPRPALALAEGSEEMSDRVSWLLEAFERAPDDCSIRVRLGNALHRSDRASEGIGLLWNETPCSPAMTEEFARLAEKAGEPARAESLWVSIAHTRSTAHGRASAWVEVSRLRRINARLSSAINACRIALALHPTSDAAHIENTKNWLFLGDLDRAKSSLEQVADSEVRLDLMTTMEERRKGGGSGETNLRTALQKNPGDDEVRLRLHSVLLARKHASEALELLGPILDNAPRDPRVSLAHARSLAAIGRHEEAVAAFENHISRHGSSGLTVIRESAAALAMAGRYDEASVRLDGASYLPEDLLVLASYQTAAGQVEEAFATVHDAQNRWPDNPDIALALARIRSSRGAYTDAINILAPLADNPLVQADLTEALYRGGRSREAAQVIAEMSPLIRDTQRVHLLSIRVHTAGGDRRQAALALDQADKVAGDAPREITRIADTASSAGLHHEALRRYRRAVDIDPGFVPAQVGEAISMVMTHAHGASTAARSAERTNGEDVALRLSRAWFSTGEPDSAAAVAERSLHRRPDDPLVRVAAGRALLEIGDVTDALSHLERARELTPEDPRTLLALGRALVADTNLPAAQDAFQRAYELDPRGANGARALLQLADLAHASTKASQ